VKRSQNNSLGTQRGDSNALGDISYTEQGAGPAALFVHGVFNKELRAHWQAAQQGGVYDISPI
jgi:hypothetical protein